MKIKPSGSYLDTLTDFADMLGSLSHPSSITPKAVKRPPPREMPPLRVDDNIDDILRDAEKAANDLTKDISPAEAAPEETPKPSLDELMAQLDELVGLTKIKESVRSLINFVRVRKLREDEGLPMPPVSLHMVFTGNPGTGKTTVARIMGGLYRAIGVLSKGHLIETDRSGLVAGFVGQTAIKTNEIIGKALGGILFIDEAYALATAEGNDFGHEAIEALLKQMEDNRADLVIIVAGYDDLMEQFINSNPGLQSRFNRYFAFEDYNGEELLSIFDELCKKNEYALDDDAKAYAKEYFLKLYDERDENFGNARDVRNFFENVIAVHSDRISTIEKPTRVDLTSVIKSDIEKAGNHGGKDEESE